MTIVHDVIYIASLQFFTMATLPSRRQRPKWPVTKTVINKVLFVSQVCGSGIELVSNRSSFTNEGVFLLRKK